MRKAICKYCGEEFEYSNRGKARVHCKKEECLKKAKNEAQRKWYANKMKVLKGTKNRIVERKEEKKILYSSTDKVINVVVKEDFSDVLEIARKLGSIRYEIAEKIKSLSPEQSKYDKIDEIFLHKIEGLMKQDEILETDVLKVFREYLDKRPNRRVVKDKQEMLKHLSMGIISNPNEYVVQFIKDRDKRTYNPQKEGQKNATDKK